MAAVGAPVDPSFSATWRCSSTAVALAADAEVAKVFNVCDSEHMFAKGFEAETDDELATDAANMGLLNPAIAE